MEAIHFDPCGRWASADARDVEELRARQWRALGLEELTSFPRR